MDSHVLNPRGQTSFLALGLSSLLLASCVVSDGAQLDATHTRYERLAPTVDVWERDVCSHVSEIDLAIIRFEDLIQDMLKTEPSNDVAAAVLDYSQNSRNLSADDINPRDPAICNDLLLFTEQGKDLLGAGFGDGTKYCDIAYPVHNWRRRVRPHGAIGREICWSPLFLSQEYATRVARLGSDPALPRHDDMEMERLGAECMDGVDLLARLYRLKDDAARCHR